MEDIKVTSIIDLKTYFNISLMMYLRFRTIVIILITFGLLSYTIMSDPSCRWWEEAGVVAVLLIIYGGLIPYRLYLTCSKNIKKMPALYEPLYFTINEEKIEFKAESLSLMTKWPQIEKLVEREKYFLLMNGRTFNFLPKAGFADNDDIIRFKNMVKQKGIKMVFNLFY
ncbi:YcxB family protein [Mucilaginibacter sp.]|uniref:YcxB family protein n=1 Tax=Mucilaginibacter sp. TaxID=1882438 RepID=UPI003D0EAC92